MALGQRIREPDWKIALKAIAFTLFGTNPLYCRGAIRNAQLAKTIYPGWTAIFWVERAVPESVAGEIQAAGAQVRPYSARTIPNGMFARFLVNDEPGIKRYLVRDVDSRLTEREREAVAQWERSGKLFHVMRDHPYHGMPIMGGTWGCVGGVIPDMNRVMRRFPKFRRRYTREWGYGIDQEFLMQEIWPVVKSSALAHDSCTRDKFPDSAPFPTGMKLGDWRFVGEVFDENDQPDPHHWQMRVNRMEAP